ncbi:hypothetical protein KOW79_018563 [Hemibagrus wyckioides]|uniref:Uncharacterized protein n=1 Tax=Hemibagrus wyckioides TaxID=337641 RepID=A0A9D3N6Z6_9TELE|nr:hypothetical protein KOW79_018563 [Hemibagrus wyckioides]
MVRRSDEVGDKDAVSCAGKARALGPPCLDFTGLLKEKKQGKKERAGEGNQGKSDLRGSEVRTAVRKDDRGLVKKRRRIGVRKDLFDVMEMRDKKGKQRQDCERS